MRLHCMRQSLSHGSYKATLQSPLIPFQRKRLLQHTGIRLIGAAFPRHMRGPSQRYMRRPAHLRIRKSVFRPNSKRMCVSDPVGALFRNSHWRSPRYTPRQTFTANPGLDRNPDRFTSLPSPRPQTPFLGAATRVRRTSGVLRSVPRDSSPAPFD